MAARLAFVVTEGLTAAVLMRGQLRYLADRDFDVHLLAAPGPDLQEVGRQEQIATHAVPLRREMHAAADLRALVGLRRSLAGLGPQVVNAGTPKAGLLGMSAARLARVRIRIYTLRGLRLETTTGLRRIVLATAERFAARLAHRVVCVSGSLRQRCIQLRLAPERKLLVLGDGSSNGVDLKRFRPRTSEEDGSMALRRQLDLPAGGPVIGFVGRLTRDKGVADLLAAFDRVSAQCPAARLLLIGDLEIGDPVPRAIAGRLTSDPRIARLGFQPDAAPYYHLMDVLAFPSRREGFPNAPLEAAASGIPVAGYRVTGTVDAVVDGTTGTLVPAADVEALAEALCRYTRDPDLAAAHGLAGRRRAERSFARERIWREWEDLYRALLAERGG